MFLFFGVVKFFSVVDFYDLVHHTNRWIGVDKGGLLDWSVWIGGLCGLWIEDCGLLDWGLGLSWIVDWGSTNLDCGLVDWWIGGLGGLCGLGSDQINILKL